MAFGNAAMNPIMLRNFNYTYVWWDEDGNQQMSPEFRHPHDYAVWIRANLPRIEEQERRMREKREEAGRNNAKVGAADAEAADAEPAAPEPAAPSGGVVEDDFEERREKQSA